MKTFQCVCVCVCVWDRKSRRIGNLTDSFDYQYVCAGANQELEEKLVALEEASMKIGELEEDLVLGLRHVRFRQQGLQ